MFDITLRPLKDGVADPLCHLVPSSVTPNSISALAFIAGLASCYCSATGHTGASLVLWLLNRVLDCVDGALARQRKCASDLGGLLDLLGDFIIYSLIPISCALGSSDKSNTSLWLSVTAVEASFHVNNFVLFYVAAVVEKTKAKGDEQGTKELTSVAMRPALIEGFESGAIFTLMIWLPDHVELLCWLMTSLVCIGVIQRVVWVVPVLSRSAGKGD